MSYSRQSLGSTSCSAGQSYRGDVIYNGLKGQCLTAQQYADCKAGKIAGCSMAPASSTASSIVSSLVSVLTKPAAPAVTNLQVQPVSSGVSTTTIVAVAGGAVVLALLLSRR